MRILTFAKRNFKEILRDPINLAFCFAFPIVLLLVMELIVSGIGGNTTATPQFEINNLSVSIVVFSFSFLTLFSSMLISKDRQSSFQTRLLVSPMRPYEFILGYSLPLIPIAIIQTLIGFLVSIFFGLTLSWSILLSILALIPVSLLFIGLGLLIGASFNDKTASGVSSIIINLAVILGGMFFPIQLMTGILPVIAKSLPFYPALDFVRSVLNTSYSNWYISLLTVLGYTTLIFIFAILIFYKKMKDEK